MDIFIYAHYAYGHFVNGMDKKCMHYAYLKYAKKFDVSHSLTDKNSE